MFKRIGKHDLTSVEAGQFRVKYGADVDGKFYGITYYEVEDSEALNYAYSFIPSSLRSEFAAVLMVVNYHDIPPHIDDNLKVAVNFYLTGPDYKTQLYLPGDSPRTARTGYETGDGRMFDPQTVIPVDSFVADRGDIYVLDVKQIHGVHGEVDSPLRLALQLHSFTISYTELMANYD